MFIYVYLSVGLCTWEQWPEKGVIAHGAGVIDNSEPLDVGLEKLGPQQQYTILSFNHLFSPTTPDCNTHTPQRVTNIYAMQIFCSAIMITPNTV